MQKLYVDKTIEIEAPLFGVWDVLIRPAYTQLWAPEFYGGSPFRIESEWRIGAPVLWKDGHDQIIVEGNVTRLEPEKFLRFTAFDVHTVDRPAVTEEDGITFELIRRETNTLLHLRQGDFSGMADGEQYRQMSEQVWDRVLPRIKQLAEGSAREM